MFRLMIVEDEKITRDGLCRHIDWNALDVEVTLSVSNGLEAVMATDNVAPDILLSDIKMPHMTGIELAEAIRRRFPRCKIIFLSGYADKEYLMSAIQLKAVSYIEKPVNLDEISKAVKTAVEQLKAEQEEAMIHNSFQQTRPLVNYEIVSALLSPHTDWKRFKSDFVPLYFDWSRVGRYTIACIQFSALNIPREQIKVLVTEAIEYLYRQPVISPSDCYISNIFPDVIIMIVRSAQLDFLKPVISQLQQHFLSTYCIDTSAAISAPCMTLTEIPTLYDSTRTALDCEVFYGEKTCLLHPPLPVFPCKPVPPELFIANELNLSALEKLFAKLRGEAYTDIGAIRSGLFKIYMIVAEKNWNDRITSWNEFERLTLKEYKELIFNEITVLKILGNGTYDIKIKKAIHYILDRYSMADLSVKMIADHIGLSQNYLSSLFKNQTGSTVNDFITEVRLRETCILLTNTDLKLYEIAERIGLQDPNYLSALFKKQFSVTPSQYKKGLADQ